MTDSKRSTGPAAEDTPPAATTQEDAAKPDPVVKRPKGPQQPPGEIGGRDGPEPTRYGDWEVGGRCTDF